MSEELIMLKNSYTGERFPRVATYSTEILTTRAKFVQELITRWGMVQAVDDGEDSYGRHKLKLMSPKEVVDRAIEITALMYDALAEHDLLITAPTFDELKKTFDEEDEKIIPHTARRHIKDSLKESAKTEPVETE